MGNYNPHQPYILGQEWVPIRDVDLQYSPGINSVERGVPFVNSAIARVHDARFYLNQMQATAQFGQVALVNLYPNGQEDQTGPLEQVIIPVSAGEFTTTSGNTQLLLASTIQEAVYQPGDSKGVISYFVTGGLVGTEAVRLFFNIDAFPVLNGKRILNVSMLYSGYAQAVDGEGNVTPYISPNPTIPATVLQITNDAASQTFSYGSGTANTLSNMGALSGLATATNNAGDSPTLAQTIAAVDLGDINHWWETTAPNNFIKQPWRYTELLRYASNATNRLGLRVRFQLQISETAVNASTPSIVLEYAALRVIFCEEKRIGWGARKFVYPYGANVIALYDTSLTVDPVLPASQILPTLSWVSPGQIDFGEGLSGDFPKINAVQELYQIPSHPAVNVNVPFPLDESIGETFETVSTHILPQLSLHASGSGGTLTGPHVYGRQLAAQVYGSITATQDIYDDGVGVATTYQQVRYYARRFGDTTVPLTLTGVGGLSGSTVSITVAEFDALQKILDGWAEVTLRFASPPSMGAVAGNPAWTWSAVGETSGNRWEILGASAPAISGVPSSLHTQVVASNRLGSATYQPPLGDTVELTWMPQGVSSPYVTGVSAAAADDAVLIFSVDPPTVTGFALSAQTQVVTGIGMDCGSLPCCIPSGIAYQRVTWSATTLPTTGFGAYELQRFDYLDPTGDFQTVMLATSPTVTGFNDFEARVGITSVYRIRALNALNFAGQWSTYVSGAPPAPGVTGGCADATGALIFTSNADQSGASNAAYVMQWDGTPDETFSFPEADMVVFQPVYQRDGVIAFHGTERGLETFSRTLLLNAAAIDPIRLADAKTVRDLAWADLPYVCVRDDIGDRWFANVRVPNVSARQNRTKYTGRVEITETTVTPYAVDP